MAMTIDENTCIGCGCCLDACAFGALELSGYKAVISVKDCTECKLCRDMCPVASIHGPGE
jgi:ferredoxin